MPTPNESLYSAFLADLSESERERVQHLAEQFGIDPTDAVWALMIVLGRYSDIYAAVPGKIELTVQGLLEKIQTAAGDGEAIRERVEHSVREAVVEIVQGQVDHMAALYDEVPKKIDQTVQGVFEKVEKAARADSLAIRNRMQRSMGRVLLNALVRREGRKELMKGLGIAFLGVSVVFCVISALSYWVGFDHGRIRGFTAGAEGKVIGNWAVSQDGLGAYQLWKSGELGHLVACDRPGWKVEDGVCVPRASGTTVYGWRLH
jgi:hypothetical protein